MRPPRLLASGTWVLALAVAVVTVVFSLHVWRMLRGRGHAVGDGTTVASYGFSLTPATIPVDRIVAAGMPRDGLPALVDPAVTTAEGLQAARGSRRGKVLVPSDRVVGVRLGGAARAYPLRFLAWHEVANDTLAGRPIAITYNPLCDSVVVFSREAGDEVLTFGVSGLLYNSNLLMYDRRSDGGTASLWSQLLARAVAGPAAARPAALAVLPATVTTWTRWREAHPDTTVLAPDARLAAQYRRDPYASYFGSDKLRFPVDPLMPTDGLALKTPVVVLQSEAGSVAIPFPTVRAHAGPDGAWNTTVLGRAVRLVVGDRPPTVDVQLAEDSGVGVVYTFAFAWHAMHPDAPWLQP